MKSLLLVCLCWFPLEICPLARRGNVGEGRASGGEGGGGARRRGRQVEMRRPSGPERGGGNPGTEEAEGKGRSRSRGEGSVKMGGKRTMGNRAGKPGRRSRRPGGRRRGGTGKWRAGGKERGRAAGAAAGGAGGGASSPSLMAVK